MERPTQKKQQCGKCQKTQHQKRAKLVCPNDDMISTGPSILYMYIYMLLYMYIHIRFRYINIGDDIV